MIGFGKSACDVTFVRARSATAPCTARAAPWILAATILGSSMVFIDGTVVNVALPALQQQLNATASDAQWVVEAYALTLAALLLVGGALGDRLGRRRVYLLGVIVFALASVWAGLAPSIEQLILARGLQGIGGALLVPGSLAIISASFVDAERGRAIGTWSALTGVTTAFGPVLGGYLVDHFSWRWAFLVNLPLAIIVVAVTWVWVPESRDDKASGRLDWWGTALATIGLGGIVYALIEAPNQGWHQPMVIGAFALGIVVLAAFVAVEVNLAAPMLPLGLFRSRDFAGANLLTLLLYAALGGGLFFFPLNLIQVQGYSATAAGAAMLPFVLIMFALSRWAGGLVDRHGAKLPLVVGPIIAALGFALFALPGLGGSYWTTFLPAVAVLGLGFAISVAPLTTTVMSSVDEQSVGVASGINNAVSRVAGLVALAVLGILLASVFAYSLDARLADLDLPASVQQVMVAERTKLAGAELPGDWDAPLRAALKQAVDESFVAGFRAVMLSAAGLALLSALSGWWMIGARTGRQSSA